jgi:hypothetical protein
MKNSQFNFATKKTTKRFTFFLLLFIFGFVHNTQADELPLPLNIMGNPNFKMTKIENSTAYYFHQTNKHRPKKGISDSLGNVILPNIFEINAYNRDSQFSEYITLIFNKKSGVFDLHKLKWRLKPEYEEIRFSEKVILIKKNHLYGVLDINFQAILPLEYANIYNHHHLKNLLLLSEKSIDGQFLSGIYDLDKNAFSISCIPSEISIIDGWGFLIQNNTMKKLYNFQGQLLLEKDSSYFHFINQENVLSVNANHFSKIYKLENSMLKDITPIGVTKIFTNQVSSEEQDLVWIVKKGENYGLVDKNYRYLINCNYDQLTFYTYGNFNLILGIKSGEYCLFDNSGKKVMHNIFHTLQAFEIFDYENRQVCQMLNVIDKKNQKSHVYNLREKTFVHFENERIAGISQIDSIYVIEKNGLFGIYNFVTNKYKIKPKYDYIGFDSKKGWYALQGSDSKKLLFISQIESNGSVSTELYNDGDNFESYNPNKNEPLKDWKVLINKEIKEVKSATQPYNSVEIRKNIESNYSVVKNKNDKYGLVNAYNRLVLPIEFDEIQSFYKNDSFFKVRLKNVYGVYSLQHHKWVLPLVFKDINLHHAQTFIAQANGKDEAFNLDGIRLIDDVYESLHVLPFFPDYISVNKGDAMGIFHIKEQKYIIPTEYNSITFVGENYFKVRKNENYYFIDTNNQLVFPKEEFFEHCEGCYYRRYQNFSIEKKNGFFGAIDGNLNVIIPFKYKNITFSDNNLIIENQSSKFGILNTKGEIILPFEYDEINKSNYKTNTLFTKKDDHYGILTSGNKNIEPTYHLLKEVCAENSIVKKSDKMGVISNHNGSILLDLIYDSLYTIEKDGKNYFVGRNSNGYDIYSRDFKPIIKNVKTKVKDIFDFSFFTDITFDKVFLLVEEKKNKYNLLDSKGRKMVRENFDDVNQVKNQMFILVNNAKYGIYNPFNETLKSDFLFDSIQFDVHAYNPSKYSLYGTKGNSFYIIKVEGDIISIEPFVK